VFVDPHGQNVYFTRMSAAEIINQVQKLPPEEVFEVGRWIREYEADLWDKQIEADIHSGKLDKLGAEAIEELRAGRTRPFPE